MRCDIHNCEFGHLDPNDLYPDIPSYACYHCYKQTNCIHVFTDKEFDGHRWCVKCDRAIDEENVERRDAVYSGPGKSGICVCGCSWNDHHLGMVLRLGRVLTKQGTYEHYIAQECDRFGFNEYGGLKYNEETEKWETHCHAYKDCGYLEIL